MKEYALGPRDLLLEGQDIWEVSIDELEVVIRERVREMVDEVRLQRRIGEHGWPTDSSKWVLSAVQVLSRGADIPDPMAELRRRETSDQIPGNLT